MLQKSKQQKQGQKSKSNFLLLIHLNRYYQLFLQQLLETVYN